MLVWLYGVNFFIGVLVLLPSYATLREETGFSLEYLKLLNGFDYTVYADFRHNHASAVDPLLTVGFWLGIAYLFLSLFFSGGILLQVRPDPNRRQPFQLSRFLAASVQCFGRFLWLWLCVAGFIALAGLAVLFVGMLLGAGLSDLFDERALIYFMLGCFFLFGLVTLFVLCVGDYAKILLFRQDENRVFPALRQALRFVWGNLRINFGLYLLLVSIGAVCFAIYFLIESGIVTSGWAAILVLFVFQQGFVFSRIVLKVWMLATARLVIANRERQLNRPIFFQTPETE